MIEKKDLGDRRNEDGLIEYGPCTSVVTPDTTTKSPKNANLQAVAVIQLQRACSCRISFHIPKNSYGVGVGVVLWGNARAALLGEGGREQRAIGNNSDHQDTEV